MADKSFDVVLRFFDGLSAWANSNHVQQDLIEKALLQRRLIDAKKRNWTEELCGVAFDKVPRSISSMKKDVAENDYVGRLRTYVENCNLPEPTGVLIAATGAGPKRESELSRVLYDAGFKQTASIQACIKQAVHDGYLRRIGNDPYERDKKYGQAKQSYKVPEPITPDERIERKSRVVGVLCKANDKSPTVKLSAELTADGIKWMQNYLSTDNRNNPIIKAVDRREIESQKKRKFDCADLTGAVISTLGPVDADHLSDLSLAWCCVSAYLGDERYHIRRSAGTLDKKGLSDLERVDLPHIEVALGRAMEYAIKVGDGERTLVSVIVIFAVLGAKNNHLEV